MAIKLIRQDHRILTPYVALRHSLQVIEEAGRLCYNSKPSKYVECPECLGSGSQEITDSTGRTYSSTCPLCGGSNQVSGDTGSFIKRLAAAGHYSVLEHSSMSVEFTTDRGVGRELVRHRLAAVSKRSTRYCDDGGKAIEFIIPVRFPNLREGLYEVEPNKQSWMLNGAHLEDLGITLSDAEFNHLEALDCAAYHYQEARDLGQDPQEARDYLPLNHATRFIMTANFREWRHIFTLRAKSKGDANECAVCLTKECQSGKKCKRAAHPQMVGLVRPLLHDVNVLLPEVFADIAELRLR